MVGSRKARKKVDPGPGSAQWSKTLSGLSVDRTSPGLSGVGVGGGEGLRYLQKKGWNTSYPGRELGPVVNEEREIPASGLKASEGRALWRHLSHQAQGFNFQKARGCSPPSLDILLSNSMKQYVHTHAAS